MKSEIELLGTTIPRIGTGTLYITRERGFGPALDNAVALLREAKDLGVRFFDTADSYGSGAAENAVREALHPYDGLIVTTKGGFRHERLHAWTADARPAHLREALEGSLKRLGVEAITLYQLHCPDHRVPYSESVGALADMQREGKIRHIGVSNVSLHQLKIARREAEIVSVQNPYNFRRGWRNEVVDYCESNGLVFLPWMPLGDGGISWDNPVLRRIVAKHAASPPQIALAALLHRSHAILPIPGTSNPEHLRDNVASLQVALDEDDIRQLWPDKR